MAGLARCRARTRRFGSKQCARGRTPGHPAVLPRPHDDPQATAGAERGPPVAPRARRPGAGPWRRGCGAAGGPPGYPDSIVLANAGRAGLAELTKPLAVDELVRLAGVLARAVAGMHRRRVMHRNISPANVVVSGKGVPTLIDFGLATSVPELRPEFTPQRDRRDAGVPDP
jgi:Protein kinase domain